MADEIKPEVPVINNDNPRTKEDWEKLGKENPALFVEKSQPRIDELTRKEREAREKLVRETQEKENLLAEIERLKQPQIVNNDQPIQYGNGVYPKTQEEWDNLFIEKPTFANDLRNEFKGKQISVQNDYVETQNKARKIVQEEHPDMYIAELAEDGTQKKDDKGNVILKLENGQPIFDPYSEKGKLWSEIFYEDQNAWSSKNAPKLLMAEMERRLRVKGKNMINAQNNVENDESGLAPKGVTPPKKSSLKFASEEERALAQKAVTRGTYKSEEEYCEWRDKGAAAMFDHPNSRPDFQKR